MPPLDRRRRRRRILPVALVVLVAAVVLALLVGGIADVDRASGPYRSDVNRSYAAQGAPLVDQSNQTGSQLLALMGAVTGLRRNALQHRLGQLVAESSRTAASTQALAPPDPTVAGLPTVMADRARAVQEVQHAVGGVLGLDGRTTVTSAQAAADLTAAGSLLERADREYRSVRSRFRTAPGRARLPGSRWITYPEAWTTVPMQDLVTALTVTPDLAVVHRVVIRPGTVRLSPAAVPPAKPGGSPTVIPTKDVQVGLVVVNEGDVDEPAATATATATPQGAGAAHSASARVAVAAGASVAVTLPRLHVDPGATYTLDVSVTVPGQSSPSGASASYTVRVATPTPPTTTTTTTTPASTTRPASS